MTRKTWSTADVSAYLDGELKPEIQVAFDTAITQDPDLQRRVAEMQQVVTLLRSVPLQEPPRNYLLTPTMVSESKPRPRRPRLPLLMMRVATSVAAAAFAVASGLTLMQQGITPTMMTRSRELPNAAVMLDRESPDGTMEMLDAPMAQAVSVEEFAESEAPAAPALEKAVTDEVTLEEEAVPEAAALSLPTPSEQSALSIEEPSAEAMGEIPAVEVGIGGGGEVLTRALGIGGGLAAEPEADSIAAQVEGTETPSFAAALVEPLTTDSLSQETMQAEVETAPAEMAAAPQVTDGETVAIEAPMPPVGAVGETIPGDESAAGSRIMPQEEETPDMAGESIENAEGATRNTRVAQALWAPIGLGIVTVALAAITYWMSRRQFN